VKFYFLLFTVFICGLVNAQDISENYQTKKVPVRDSIQVDSVSINPIRFEIFDGFRKKIDTSLYQINYKTGVLILSEALKKETDSITINYVKYPKFLTRKYFKLDPKIIVDSNGAIERLYSLQESSKETNVTFFDGLTTSGSISRGISIGNNQNAVVNSELDLQITGKLSDKVSIRASIQDANIPTQEGGYSQNLDEFDQIFIELFSDTWKIRAGDINLQNDNTYFGNFTKKVQGISLEATLTHKDSSKTRLFASGALVRGVFSKSEFLGQEGNQGPYKLIGPNGELFILIVSGSERVYINGLLLQRGENKDYVIDYNAGEIRFNATYPITSNMRIRVEYQFTDRNFTRFIGYGGGEYSNKTFSIGAYVYSESDAKNQPLQQNLSEEQVAILINAGDEQSNMTAPSAIPDSFSENKILYKKELFGSEEIFVFSNNPEDELFNVRFTLVGENNGNYIISDANAISRIFEFIAPISGVLQGNYEPVIQLVAPTKQQLAGVYGSYQPSEKTTFNFELTGSSNDLNLFSSLDDSNNDGFAARISGKQTILKNDNGLLVDGFATFNYIQEDFNTIERIYNVEFNRDWTLENPLGNQSFITGGVSLSHPKTGTSNYQFQKLDYSESFNGSRHLLLSDLHFNKTHVSLNTSYVTSAADTLNATFLRLHGVVKQSFSKGWVGGKISLEDNEQKNKVTDSLTLLTQKFNAYEVFTGIGDSTKVFAEIGYQYRENDSVQNNLLSRVNTSNTYYLKSKLFNTTNTQLSIYANYRNVQFEDEVDSGEALEDEQSLSARVSYTQRLFKNAIVFSTSLESNSGVIPQQEFTYLEVEPGQGIYTWNDYNGNNIQELEEFEVAQFQDEAAYIRVLLPNRIFVKIHQNAFSQNLILNPQQWSVKTGFKKILSHFYNQTSYLIDRKVRREGNSFTINPFKDEGDNQLGLRLNFKNSLFFNRGKQRYTTSYTYLSSINKNLLSTGLQENKLESHQLNFTHKIAKTWLLNFKNSINKSESISENFPSRNFILEGFEVNPKVSYLWNKSIRLDISYSFLNKENTLSGEENLDQQELGLLFSYTKSQKFSATAEFKYISNDFTGNPFSPVAYQLLEGLQPGTNFTWSVLLQKKITKFLDVNFSYFGRKSETSSTIHTGSVQLRAFF